MDGEVPQQVHSLLSDNGYSFHHFLNLLVQFWPPYHLSQYYNMHIIYKVYIRLVNMLTNMILLNANGPNNGMAPIYAPLVKHS